MKKKKKVYLFLHESKRLSPLVLVNIIERETQTKAIIVLLEVEWSDHRAKCLFDFKAIVFNGGDSRMVCSKITQHHSHVLLCPGAYFLLFRDFPEKKSRIGFSCEDKKN